MTITQRKIRKVRKSDNYQVKIAYITGAGVKRFVSFFAANKADAKTKLNFRLNGITQGSKVVYI